MRTVVLVPTYNERDNLGTLVRRIFEVCPGLDVLVVDDDSPDGTGRLAEELRGECPRLRVLHRTARTGLGDAYREAMDLALAEGYDYLVTMDADLSHDPAYLPGILSSLANSDLVVGSRYLRGISIVNWPLRRLALSQAANLYARVVTGLKLRDCTSGFMGLRRQVLETIPLHRIRSQGYGFVLEIKYLAQLFGFRLTEVPIIFVERDHGCSKMSFRVAWEAFWKVLGLGLFGRRHLRRGGSA